MTLTKCLTPDIGKILIKKFSDKFFSHYKNLRIFTFKLTTKTIFTQNEKNAFNLWKGKLMVVKLERNGNVFEEICFSKYSFIEKTKRVKGNAKTA